MKLSQEQFLQQVANQPLRPVYLLTGDDPLLLAETKQALLAQAHQQGFNEQIQLTVNAQFNWQRLHQESASLSLFSERRILVLALGESKPGQPGSKALHAYLQTPPPDTLLLILAAKLDNQTLKSKWVEAIHQAGVIVQIWPLDARQAPQWIAGRAKQQGLQLSPEAIALLYDKTEGNLLACDQEIKKLALLYTNNANATVTPLTLEQVAESICDSAKFSLFALADQILQGQHAKVLRILAGLRAEGTEPILILWLLAREIRLLANLQLELSHGKALTSLWSRYQVWPQRRGWVQQALNRLDFATCQQLLSQASAVDSLLKGAKIGNIWQELTTLSLRLAGLDLKFMAADSV